MAEYAAMSPLHAQLPVNEVLKDLSRALESSPSVILQAPPGSGKTTRVPPALLEASWLTGEDPGVHPLGGVDVHQLG